MGERYDIVKAGGGVSGAFSTIAYNPAFAAYLTPQIQYAANNVYLRLNANPLAFATGSGVIDNGYIVNQSLLGTTDAVLAAHKGYWLHGLGSFGHANGADATD